jgi:hypothetical protein
MPHDLNLLPALFALLSVEVTVADGKSLPLDQH